MNLPEKNLDTPFNITRASHVVMTVKDLAASRRFYTELVGLVVSDEDADTVYLRGLEEACHHSMVLKQSNDAPVCETLGMRVLREKDLDLLKAYLDGKGCKTEWLEVLHQGRTLRVSDISGVRVEFCASMTVVPRPLTQFHLYKGGCAHRIDHYQILVPDVQAACDFYMAQGFRLSEYIVADTVEEVAGIFLQRKGNPHDIVYFRDPDGHRVELFTTHYQIMDIECEPIRWDKDSPMRKEIWGLPPLRSWVEDATPFAATKTQPPKLTEKGMTLERFLASRG